MDDNAISAELIFKKATPVKIEIGKIKIKNKYVF